MARMYSKKRGKSGSTKPSEKKVQTWMRYKPAEIEKLIIKLAKSGKSAGQMGLYLRDNYGVSDVKTATGKTITAVLADNKLLKEIPDDLIFLMRKSLQINRHFERNHKDMTAKRGLELTSSKIRKLVGYYKKKERLPKDWKFDLERIKLYVG